MHHSIGITPTLGWARSLNTWGVISKEPMSLNNMNCPVVFSQWIYNYLLHIQGSNQLLCTLYFYHHVSHATAKSTMDSFSMLGHTVLYSWHRSGYDHSQQDRKTQWHRLQLLDGKTCQCLETSWPQCPLHDLHHAYPQWVCSPPQKTQILNWTKEARQTEHEIQSTW